MRKEVLGDCTLLLGDCREAMAQMEVGCVDAVVTDPPYGLEFMGADWDRLDAGLPQEAVWKGRRGKGGSRVGNDDSKPASRHHVVLGAGKQHGFHRCQKCGKRQFSGSPCECPEPDLVLEFNQASPSASIRMQRWHEQWARVAYSALKPSGYLLAFGGTRTFHRLACALEDAGFEMRDTVSHLFGSDSRVASFVASLNDEQRGAFEELAAPSGPLLWCHGQGFPKAKSCLKPCWEPVLLCRRPGRGVLPLSIDECRIPIVEEERDIIDNRSGSDDGVRNGIYRDGVGKRSVGEKFKSHSAGRYPANLVLSHHEDCRCVGTKRVKGTAPPGKPSRGVPGKSATIYGEYQNNSASGHYTDADGMEVVEEWFCVDGCPVKAFEVYGERKGSPDKTWKRNASIGYGGSDEGPDANGYGDSGSAARFFYCPKASRSDRGEGNTHPTVKSTALMEWLVRLISKSGDVVLDPFMGSGSTALACIRSGRKFIGIEKSEEYFTIACNRIRAEYERSPLFATSGTE